MENNKFLSAEGKQIQPVKGVRQVTSDFEWSGICNSYKNYYMKYSNVFAGSGEGEKKDF